MSDKEPKAIESKATTPKDKYKKYDNFISFVFGIIIFIITILTFVVNWKIGLILLGSTIIIGIIYYYMRKFINNNQGENNGEKTR